jgi:hypothetical protein
VNYDRSNAAPAKAIEIDVRVPENQQPFRVNCIVAP